MDAADRGVILIDGHEGVAQPSALCDNWPASSPASRNRSASMSMRLPVSRRRLLATAAASTALSAASGLAKPYLSRAADRPLITHGIQSGGRLGRFRRDLGARRPSRAHVGRGRDDR